MGSAVNRTSAQKSVKSKATSTSQNPQSDTGHIPNKGLLSWFEIPAYDFKRAVSFYDTLFNISMEISEVNGYSMALFPADQGMSGALICGEGSVPSDKGPLLYLKTLDTIESMLPRIEQMGGRVLLGKTQISESAGNFALFLDSEGNKLALHEK